MVFAVITMGRDGKAANSIAQLDGSTSLAHSLSCRPRPHPNLVEFHANLVVCQIWSVDSLRVPKNKTGRGWGAQQDVRFRASLWHPLLSKSELCKVDAARLELRRICPTPCSTLSETTPELTRAHAPRFGREVDPDTSACKVRTRSFVQEDCICNLTIATNRETLPLHPQVPGACPAEVVRQSRGGRSRQLTDSGRKLPHV